MKILLRLKVFGTVVSIIETEDSIDIETHGIKDDSKQKKDIIKYLEDEGILEEVLLGNCQFATPLTEQDS
jgi:hypothetical protein